MASKKTKIVRLNSTAKTGYFKTTRVNVKATEKLRKKMYDPKVRKHVEFTEAKV